MYVNPEVWILPLRWRENTVQFSPPSPDPEEENQELFNPKGGGLGLGLGFASTVRLKRAAGLAAATARGRVNSAAAAGRGGVATGGTEDDTWRVFQAGRVEAGAGAGKHRRASLPGGLATGAAALGLKILRSQEQQQQRPEAEGDMVDGADGWAGRSGRTRGDEDGVGVQQESAAEIEVSYAGTCFVESAKVLFIVEAKQDLSRHALGGA